jgi:chromosome segregation ATPase
MAMDAADDNWSIADPVQDANQKIAALTAHRQGLGQQLEASAQQAGDRIADGKHALENTVAEIRAQIAQLEQLLEREITRSAQEIAAIEGSQRAAREAVAREQRRLDQEIERLGEIPAGYTETQ